MVIHIPIEYIQTSTWELDGGVFHCAHDDIEVVSYIEDYNGANGHYQTEYRGYACYYCGESVDGNPDIDRQDMIAEMQLMELLDK